MSLLRHPPPGFSSDCSSSTTAGGTSAVPCRERNLYPMDHHRIHKDAGIVRPLAAPPPSDMLSSARSKPAPSKWDDAQKWIFNPAAAPHKRPPPPPPPRPPPTKIVLEVTDPAIRLSQHESSPATAFVSPPATARAVSMRDMGTEMTPIASQEPSRTGTPARATTPTQSPNASPWRSLEAGISDCYVDGVGKRELSEWELKMKTRREIMVLGTQLGKTNIAAWASKEEEMIASASCKIVAAEQTAQRLVEARASAWEEAEKAKYLARFKQEEFKIQAWENHQKAKAEAELKEIEAKVEKMKACAQDRLMSKLEAIRHKAEAKRGAVEAKRNQEAARTTQQAEYMRRTGRIPSSFSCWSWCNYM